MKKLLLLFCLTICQITIAQQFKYLGSFDDQGVPDYLEAIDDVLTSASMQMIKNALPESYPVPDFNPHYISAGYDTNIALQEDATVWVTFVKEGAGYKNVLGFYTYDLNDNNRQKPLDSDITIIFPNVSETGSGGGLNKGNKVKIGEFKAGTGIGWVLLANAWNGSAVTWGPWQVYSDPMFNPEQDPDLRHHVVLLSDEENERVYLGFEDIRRDYSSCDQDFNDAIFYVTANPYSAIKIQNVAKIESATDVTSANKGGLESNGKLASLIAERNFSRLKTEYDKFQKAKQEKFQQKYSVTKSAQGIELSSLIPDTGMFGTESARISSPDDLMGITNAGAVFSADYYEGEKRVAAALLTSTTNGIYDHSKVICDRLNSSSLEDIRTISLKGHELIMIKMLRASGQMEYAVNFSVQMQADLKLHSYWNIADYPEGNYLNFQVWGSNMGQVSSIAGHIIDKIQAYQPLGSDKIVGRYPTVFVKRGFYEDGRLHLVVKNKEKDTGFKITGNIRDTETAIEEAFESSVALSTEFEQEIVVNSGNLFDIGMQIKGNNSPQADALYLADGPWGIDYLESETELENFEIKNATASIANGDHHIERDVWVKGNILGTANVFRSILPGDQVFDASSFKGIEFNIRNDLPVELILVTEGLEDWDKRFRINIEPNEALTNLHFSLADFENGTSHYDGESLKAIVFSVQGDYTSFQEFQLDIATVVFTTTAPSPVSLPIPDINPEQSGDPKGQKAYNYPNPFKGKTTVVVPMDATYAELHIYDLNGKIVWSKKYDATTFKKHLSVDMPNSTPGIYKGVLLLDGRHKFTLSFLVRN